MVVRLMLLISSFLKEMVLFFFLIMYTKQTLQLNFFTIIYPDLLLVFLLDPPDKYFAA